MTDKAFSFPQIYVVCLTGDMVCLCILACIFFLTNRAEATFAGVVEAMSQAVLWAISDCVKLNRRRK